MFWMWELLNTQDVITPPRSVTHQGSWPLAMSPPTHWTSCDKGRFYLTRQHRTLYFVTIYLHWPLHAVRSKASGSDVTMIRRANSWSKLGHTKAGAEASSFGVPMAMPTAMSTSPTWHGDSRTGGQISPRDGRGWVTTTLSMYAMFPDTTKKVNVTILCFGLALVP